MSEEMVNGLIGQLNLGLIISNGRGDDMVSIPNEDVMELLLCLESLKHYISEKG